MIYDKYPELKNIKKDKFPHHVMIIPDGNRRWAEKYGKSVVEGHKRGSEVINKVLDDLSMLSEIKIITLWGFSADNWKRATIETQGIFNLINSYLKNTLSKLNRLKARFVHLGRKDRLPKQLFSTIKHAEGETENNTGQIIALAIDFGGEDQEIRIIEKAKKLPEDTIVNRDLLWTLRDGHGLIPPADLLIRSSGEIRTSDVGWLNGAPTELYFIDKLFPDVTTSDIIDAIVDFSKRERRMGSRPK